jgi:hypothetical protein
MATFYWCDECRQWHKGGTKIVKDHRDFLSGTTLKERPKAKASPKNKRK